LDEVEIEPRERDAAVEIRVDVASDDGLDSRHRSRGGNAVEIRDEQRRAGEEQDSDARGGRELRRWHDTAAHRRNDVATDGPRTEKGKADEDGDDDDRTIIVSHLHRLIVSRA
jgi:hypothetical protein